MVRRNGVSEVIWQIASRRCWRRQPGSVAMVDSEGSRVSADGWGQSLSVVDIPGAEWMAILVCLKG